MSSSQRVCKMARAGRVVLRASFAIALAAPAVCSTAVWADVLQVTGRRGPIFLEYEPSGDTLLVLCQKSGTIARVRADSGLIVKETTIGDRPFALARHPDGQRIYVSCRNAGTIVELAAESLEVLRTFALRGDPTCVAVSPDGRSLYAGLHSLDALAVLDLESGTEAKRLLAGNGPEYCAGTADGAHLYVTNLLTNSVRFDAPCELEITVLSHATRRVVERIILAGANVGRSIDFTNDGSLGLMAVSRPKNLVPLVQAARGWVVTNGLAVIFPGVDRAPVQLLVDLPNRFYADPYGLAITPDDRKAYLTASGADMVIALDMAKLRQTAEQAAAGELPDHANHLGLSRRYVTARVAVGANPVAVACSPDSRFVFVGNRLDDTLSVIDAATDRVVRTMTLGDPPALTRLDEGERFFHGSTVTFQNQFTCASCHPDEGLDGLQYDLEPDGIGQDILDNRNLRGLEGTAPFKWNGKNPDITTQCGARIAKWFFRTAGLGATDVVSLAQYIRSIEPVANPYRPADGGLTPAQQRGKALFERTARNNGEPIPVADRCHTCHAGPKFTDQKLADVGTKAAHDRSGVFDNAHLINVFESPPYLHDGRAGTLEEIWTRYNDHEKHGVSSDWTKQQLNDLIEYLKSL